MDNLPPEYNYNPPPQPNDIVSRSGAYSTDEMFMRRIEALEQQVSQMQLLYRRSDRSPHLAIRIFLYCAGILLVFMAIVLLLQSFGILTDISKTTIWAIALLAIGAGILAGMKSR